MKLSRYGIQLKSTYPIINEVKKLGILAHTIETVPRINKFQKILTVYFVFLLLYWVIIYFSGIKTGFWNYFYTIIFGLIPLVGGFLGIISSKPWTPLSSNIAKAKFFTAFGLFGCGLGNMIWIYYNFFYNIAVPYPSLADVGYFSDTLFWTIGIIYLSRATGTKFVLKQKRGIFFLLVIPFSIISFSFYFLSFVIRQSSTVGNPIKLFLDIAYPLGDVIILTFASIIFGLSVNFFRGKFKLSLLAILVGFIFLYLSHLTFTYTTSINSFFNGGISDLLITVALYLLTWGMLSFYLTPKRAVSL